MKAVVLTHSTPTPEYRREKALNAIARGLIGLGWDVCLANMTAFANNPDTSVDLLVAWGSTLQNGIACWRGGKNAAVAHIPVLAVEGGCFEDHSKRYRIGMGFPMREHILWADPSELPTEIEPRRVVCSGTALIAGQDPADPMLEDTAWRDFVIISQFGCATSNLKPFYRRHPRTPDQSWKNHPEGLTLDDRTEWWTRHSTVITATSTMSVVAAMRGCRVIASLRNNPLYGVVPVSVSSTDPNKHYSSEALAHRLRVLRGAEGTLRMLSDPAWLRRPVELIMETMRH
jgi:hypothetical protein